MSNNMNPYDKCPRGNSHTFVKFKDDIVITYSRCTNCGLVLRKQIIGTYINEEYHVPDGWPI